MISNSKQNWSVGSNVKVGFMTLTVRAAVPTPGDYAPDAYILSNAAGTQLYLFVPHNGLTKISVEEARDMLATARAQADRVARLVIAQAAARTAVEGLFA